MGQGIRGKILVAVRIAFSAALLAVLFALTDFKKVAGTLSGADPRWLAASQALIGVSVLLSAWKWRILLEAQGLKVGFWSLAGDFASGLFFNNFLPSSLGGDGARILLAGRRTGRSGEAASSVVLDRLLAGAALGSSGVAASFLSRSSSWWVALALAGIAPFSALLAFVAVRGWTPAFLRGRQGRAARFFKDFIEAGRALRGDRRAILSSFGASLLFQASVAAVSASSMAALGLPLPGPADILYLSAASSFLAMIPLGINGYGLREAAYAFLLAPYGVPAPVAVAVSVLFALSVSAFSLLGAIAWLINKPAPAAEAAPAKGA
jgi:uncharacterized membrane protein YbhN (UPF0104 family)